MTGDPLVRAKELFADALERPPDQRAAFIDATCGGDTELRNAVVELLEAHAAARRFMHDPTPAGREEPRSLAIGSKIGRYRIVELIGEGGFGTVYRAEQHAPVRREVALKVVKLGMDTRKVVARFHAERQLLAMMEHPNIARVLDGGATDDGRPYFVMEFIRGVPVVEHCQQDRLGIEERLDLFLQVCDAVQHAHQKGVIHRDLKPSNVLVVRGESGAVATVIDFGVAKAMNHDGAAESTFADGRHPVGTPQYMSPEQADRTGRDVDTRSDIYALGVLLYEMLAEAPPFEAEALRGASVDEVLRIIREDDPPTPSARLGALRRGGSADRVELSRRIASVRGDLDWIVMRCLEKERERRYETVSALASDVRRHLRGEPVLAAPPSRVYRWRKVIRRHRLAVGAGIAVAATLMAAAAVSTDLAVREAAARREAEERGAEARLVADFQARLLGQIHAAPVGGRLFRNLRDRYRAALEDEGVAGAALHQRVETFDLELARVNSTDAAAAMIDEMIIRPAIATIDADFAGQPVVASALRHTLADAYGSLGMHREALALEERSLETRRRVLGDDHPDTLDSIHATGVLLHQLDRRAEALAFAREALAGRRRVLGPGAAETLVSQSSYGAWLEGEDNAAEAERLCRAAVEGLRALDPAQARFLHDALRCLADVYVSRERAPEAEPFLLESIRLARRTWGEAHPETISSLNAYGDCLFHQRRWDECAAYTRKTLELARQVWGENHSDTVSALWNTGFLLEIMGRPDEAEPYLREFRQRRRRAYGDADGWVLNATKELAAVLLEQERPSDALELVVELDVPDLMNRPELPSVLGIRIHRGRALLALGRVPEAELWLRDTLDMARRVSGKGSTTPHAAATALGQVLAAQDRWGEAERLLDEAVAGYAADLGEPFNGTIRARVALARVLVAQSRWPEAEAQLLTAESAFVDALAVTPERHRACVRLLVGVYESWHEADPTAGHGARAAAWRERLSALRETRPPIPDPPPA